MSESDSKPKAKKSALRRGCAASLFGLALIVAFFVLANFVVGIVAQDKMRPRFYRLSTCRDIELIPGKKVREPAERVHKKPGDYTDKTVFYDIRIDSMGFRGPETTLKPKPGIARIVCMGDSSTFGWGVEEEDGYVRRLEGLLNAGSGSKRFETVNLGVFSYSSHNGRIYFDDTGIKLDPSIVVLSFGTNDSRSMGNRPNPFIRKPDRIAMPFDCRPDFRARLKKGAINIFVLPILDSNLSVYLRYRVLQRIIAAKRGKGGGKKGVEAIKNTLPPRVPIDEYGENMRAMAESARAVGAKVIFLSIGVDPEYQARLAEVAADMNAPLLIDSEIYKEHWEEALHGADYARERAWAERYFRPETLAKEPILYFRYDPVHPTPLGHRLIAGELAKAIE